MITITPEQFDEYFRCIGEPDSKFSNLYRQVKPFEGGLPNDLFILEGNELAAIHSCPPDTTIFTKPKSIIIQSEADRIRETLEKYD